MRAPNPEAQLDQPQCLYLRMGAQQGHGDHRVFGKRGANHLYMGLGKIHAELAADADACCY